MQEIQKDNGLLVVRNYGKPTAVKIIDKRHPVLTKIFAEIQEAFADISIAKDEAEEIMNEIKDILARHKK